MLIKNLLSLFSALIISCSIIGGGNTFAAAAGAEQESLTIKSSFDVMQSSPLNNTRNLYPSLYLLADDGESPTIISSWRATDKKGEVISVPISTIYNAASNYGNADGIMFSVCFGWIELNNSGAVDLSSSGTYLFSLNASSRYISAPAAIALSSALMNVTPIRLGDIQEYEPPISEDMEVGGIVVDTAKSLGDVLSWFWSHFGIYIVIAVLAIAFGIIRWARG